MRVTKEARQAHKAAILKAASALFREHGPDGVGVADITTAAGLTHGGFYRHFSSKEALLGEALEAALAETASDIAAVCAERGLAGFTNAYLSPAHVGDPAQGCPVASLGSDMARQPIEVREAYSRGLRQYVEAAISSTGGDRSEVLAQLAALVGAVIMARGLANIDQALADELLDAVRK